MGKSVYSVVLMDDVVEAIDRMAYSMNTSRSNLINQILAERVSFITPEKRMNDIFDNLSRFISSYGEGFQIQQQPSDAMISIRSALKYKYKPTIRYSLQLYREEKGTVGQLKVSFRTQSEGLKSVLTDFLKIWAGLENTYIVHFFPEGISYLVENGKFTRTFRLPPDREKQTTEEIARAIAEYIQMFDDILKIYFKYAEQPEKAEEEVQRGYIGYLEKGIVII